MADPLTLMTIGTAASVAGGLTGGLGKVFGGDAQGDMYKYQSGVAMINRDLNLQNADYARYTGELEAQRVGMKAKQEIGTAKVIQSGRGLDVNAGSAVEVRDSMGQIAAQDQATTRSNAERRAYGYEVEANKNLTQSQMYGAAAKNARTAGMIEGAGSLLGTVSSVSSKWLEASQKGIGAGRGIELGPSPDFPHAEWGSA